MGIKHWAVGAALVAFAGVALRVSGRRAFGRTGIHVCIAGRLKPKPPPDSCGKVTLVNFWATSCTTCAAEMPEIIATHNKYHAKGF